ncbi:hypothetical protein H8959_007404 [Pygathrix nigripes]
MLRLLVRGPSSGNHDPSTLPLRDTVFGPLLPHPCSPLFNFLPLSLPWPHVCSPISLQSVGNHQTLFFCSLLPGPAMEGSFSADCSIASYLLVSGFSPKYKTWQSGVH